MGQPPAGMQGPNPAGFWGWEGRGAAGPGTAQGRRGWTWGQPRGPSLVPTAQQVHRGSVPAGHLHWGATALVLSPGCFTAARDPLADQDPQTWGNLRLLSFCSSPRPCSPQRPRWAQTPQQPCDKPRPLSTVAAQEPPVSQNLSVRNPAGQCQPRTQQHPTGLPSAPPNRGQPQELVLEGDFIGTHRIPWPPQLMGVLGPREKL